jgi:hypothetical protein
MVQSQYSKASIFSIDVDNREYWITAKHVLNNREYPHYGSVTNKSVSLLLLNPTAPGEQWVPVNFSVVDPGEDVDVVVLAAERPVLENPVPTVSPDASAMLGGDCEFLGFPYGAGWRATYDKGLSYWMPYTKHCIVSAINLEGKQIFVLDGINNKGFSGDPVIVHTGAEQKILAVVSGYRLESAEVIPDSSEISGRPKEPTAHSKETVNVNAGLIIAFSIKYATDAIQKNPIGPLRQMR